LDNVRVTGLAEMLWRY